MLVIEETSVMERPSTDASLISKAYEGYDLTVDYKKSGTEPSWYYIRLGNGQYGWIKVDGVKVL